MAKKPNIDKECCTGCGICIENCPTNSLELVDDIAVLVRPKPVMATVHVLKYAP